MRFFFGAMESFASVVGCIFSLLWYGILFFYSDSTYSLGAGYLTKVVTYLDQILVDQESGSAFLLHLILTFAQYILVYIIYIIKSSFGS